MGVSRAYVFLYLSSFQGQKLKQEDNRIKMESMRNRITLVIGGCRSGKSSHALWLANQISGGEKISAGNGEDLSDIEDMGDQKERVLRRDSKYEKAASRKIFIATSVPTDGEMEARVVKHQKERGEGWQTAEIPVDIPQSIKERSPSADVILVDCLTLWVSNLMFHEFDDDGILKMVDSLEHALENASSPVFLVSNEVGMGIVPDNGLARRFRDMAGMVNQKVAAVANRVIYMVAGIPMTIKSAR